MPGSDSGSAWAPGLESGIPAPLRPLITLFRPEHAFVNHDEARELSDFTGLDVLQLVALRPERLVVHELLIRVTADLSVPDGPGYETLGLNLRAMVEAVHDGYVRPALDELRDAWTTERDAAVAFARVEADRELFARDADDDAKPAPAPSLTARVRSFLRRDASRDRGRAIDPEPREQRARARWQARLEGGGEPPLQAACLRELVVVVAAMVAHRGRLLGDADLIARVVAHRVANSHGSRLIGERLDPLFDAAVIAEGFRRLPARAEPVVLNVKGASASGKSTIRPQQRAFAERLGIDWEDFALISPDYWRKYLLDYGSLGEDYKYGAMLTGNELEMIDRKLDDYMARKAASGRMSHLLIDRFRFDSFTLVEGRTASSGLLSRFGHRVFLFFMVTPPAETVERAWKRGLSTGRYKAVDDLLHHNVEAFTGMPALFLSWVNATDREVHFEFLDNDVPEGELPRTIAFGGNGTMTVLDVEKLLDIERYRKVNVDATRPDDVFDGADLALEANLDFVRRCVAGVQDVRFARGTDATVYAWFVDGRLRWCDRSYVDALPEHDARRRVLGLLGAATGVSDDDRRPPPDLDCASSCTLGRRSADD